MFTGNHKNDNHNNNIDIVFNHFTPFFESKNIEAIPINTEIPITIPPAAGNDVEVKLSNFFDPIRGG
jgi:hypothetical protein